MRGCNPGLKYSALRPLLERIDLTALDIGASGGPEPDLLPIAFATNVVAFEPEAAAHAALEEQQPGPWKCRTILPVALGASAECRTFHVTADPQSSSLLDPNPAFGVFFDKPQFFEVRETRVVDTISLDNALVWIAAGPIGFLKLDVEGAASVQMRLLLSQILFSFR